MKTLDDFKDEVARERINSSYSSHLLRGISLLTVDIVNEASQRYAKYIATRFARYVDINNYTISPFSEGENVIYGSMSVGIEVTESRLFDLFMKEETK